MSDDQKLKILFFFHIINKFVYKNCTFLLDPYNLVIQLNGSSTNRIKFI